MTKLLYAASAAALLTMVGVTPSLAQSDTTTTASGSGMLPTTMCSDISSMDKEAAKGVFYYMAGLHKGMGKSSTQASGSATTGSSTSGSTASSGTAASGSADTSDTTASTTTPDTTASASGSSGTSGSTDTTASNTAGTSGSSTTTGSATTGSSGMMVTGLPEFSMINVDQLMAACQQSPDMQISQVISQQMGMSGSSAQ